MHYEIMSEQELNSHEVGGIAISITTILAILCSAAVAVVLYKVFLSKKGSASFGGWKFNWN